MREAPQTPSERVSVVVPTWRRAQWLERCVDAVLAQEPPPGEVLVVGRAADAEAVAVVERRAPGVRWVEVSEAGHVAPVRAGLAEARGVLVVFLDDDAEPQGEWLRTLLAPFADPRVACVGGAVVETEGSPRIPRDAGRIRWYGEFAANVAAVRTGGARDVDGVREANWAWRADVLRTLDFGPLFDTDDASMYGVDLSLQARARGHRVVYVPTAVVAHHSAPRDPALDRADAPARTFSYSRNYTYIALRHLRGARRLAFLAWWFLLGDPGSPGLLHVVRGWRRGVPARASFGGKVAGIRAWRSA